MTRPKLEYFTGIYSITNIIDNKRYIGYSENIFKRFKDHKRELNRNKHVNIHLQNSWNKFGENNFIFDIIELCEIFELPRREHHWATILYTHDENKGYNIRPTDPDRHWGNSEESKIKMRRPMSEETKEKLRQINLGRKMTDEDKKKMSEAKKGKVGNKLGSIVSGATKEKLRQSHLGKKLSPEQCKKISERMIGNSFAKGNKLSIEHKEKIAESSKNQIFSDERRKQISERQTGRKFSKEWCENISKGKKEQYFKQKSNTNVKNK